jgi:hypothetical protein
VSLLNQNHPAVAMKPTGRITPHTVTEPILPVTLGPPKLATVVSHSSPMTLMQLITGVDDSTGKNADR